ncbi:MAG: hypothetical protein WCS96_05865 [Victivallales bacterium]
MNWKLEKFFKASPVVWVPMWGISKLRKRAGSFAGEVPGDALWFDEWYDRAMSRDNVGKLAGLGVNMVVLPFSLGASAEAERRERDDFMRVTRYLHEFNVMSLPYLQYQNVLQEENVPGGTVWAESLTRERLGYSYWRRTACQSSKGFKDYFKSLIADAVKRGSDGIWIDNTYLYPCRCELCRADFVEYLKNNHSYLLNELYLRDFEGIEIPPNLDAVGDPVVQAFIEFNFDRNIRIQSELKEYMESLKADAVYGSNPALYRGRCSKDIGVDFYRLMKLNDIMYYENKFYPQEKNGQLSGNFHGFIAGDSLGTPGIPGAWKKEDFDAVSGKSSCGLPDAGGCEKTLLEAVVFGGITGAFWAVRAVPEQLCGKAEDQLKMYFELPEIYDTMKETLGYLKKLPVFGKRVNKAEIAVLYHRASSILKFEVHQASLHGIEELLLSSSIPYNTLFSEEMAEKISGFKLLIVPDARVLSDKEALIIGKFTENGGSVLILGQECGRYDERLKLRLDSALKELSGVSVFDKLAAPHFQACGKGAVAVMPTGNVYGEAYVNMMSAKSGTMLRPDYLENPSSVLNAVNQLLPEPEVRIAAEKKLGVSWALIEGRMVLQMLAYTESKEDARVKVYIAKGKTPADASLYRDAAPVTQIRGEPDGRYTVFEISVSRHAAMVFES